MTSKPCILVMGATGQVGSAVVEQLRSNATVTLATAVRDVSKAKYVRVPVARLDLDDPDTIPAALARVSRLFMVTGYSVEMLRQSKYVINAAKRAGIDDASSARTRNISTGSLNGDLVLGVAIL